MARRGYPPEFRRRVVALVEGGRKVAEVAAEFEVSEQAVYTLMDRGQLAFVKLGRSRRIPRRAVVEMAARGLRGGTNLVGRP